jgi:dolichol kinase
MPLKREEILRKILHFIFGSIIPLGIFYIPFYADKYSFNLLPSWLLPPVILSFFLILFIVIEFLRFKNQLIQKIFYRFFGTMLRKEESHKATGATYILASSVLCSCVFKDYPHISLMVLSAFIWGDAVAALVGQSLGRIKIGSKSLEGSLACFFLCMLFFILIYPNLPHVLEKWNGKIPLLLIFISSLSITIMELFPIKIRKFTINDNLLVPFITGIIMIALYPILQ